MALAGVAWGVYSLRGRSARAPLAATAGNFARAVPLALLALGLALALGARGSGASATPRGALLAVCSGALASGVCYSLWYLALPRISAVRAALVQLLVPVIAALAGVALLGEPATVRLLVAGPLILGGVALALLGKRRLRA